MLMHEGKIVEERPLRYRVSERFLKVLRFVGWIVIPLVCFHGLVYSDPIHATPIYLFLAPVLMMLNHVFCTVSMAILHIADRFCHHPIAADPKPMFPTR